MNGELAASIGHLDLNSPDSERTDVHINQGGLYKNLKTDQGEHGFFGSLEMHLKTEYIIQDQDVQLCMKKEFTKGRYHSRRICQS